MDRPFTRLILKWFWDYWDHLYLLVGMNLVAFLLSATVVGLPFALGAMFAVGARIAEAREPDWKLFWQGARRHALAATAWLLCMLGTFGAVLASFLVYPPVLGTLGYGFAGLSFWIGLGVLLVLLYVPGFLTRRDLNFSRAFRQAAILFFSHPLYSFYFGALALALLVLSVGGAPFMLPLVTFGALATGLQAGWTVIMRRYIYADEIERQEAEMRAEDESLEGKPKSWGEIKRREDAEKKRRVVLSLENDEMQRSFREIVRPWEMDQ